MLQFVAQRLTMMVFTLFVIATLTFFLAHALPGGPYQDPDTMAPEQRALFDAKYGLNKPVTVQYVLYMNQLFHGDLGTSLKYTNRSVSDMIRKTFPISAQLGLQALLLGFPVGILLGIISALNRGRGIDYALVVLAIIGVSVPSFVTASLLQYIFASKLHWFPVAFWGGFSHTILPTLALAFGEIALIARLMRTSLLDVLGSDYMKTAKAKGLSFTAIVHRHALRNAFIPIVTMFAVSVVNLITGSLIVEQIFSIPGIGQHFVNSVNTNDYPLVMGLTLFYSFLYITALFVTDVAYGLVDPRIRIQGTKA